MPYGFPKDFLRAAWGRRSNCPLLAAFSHSADALWFVGCGRFCQRCLLTVTVKGPSMNKKREAALGIAKDAGIPSRLSAPPLHRRLWRLGIDLPPPPFASFTTIAVLNGVPFAVLFGFFTWLLQPLIGERPFKAIVLTALIAASVFGPLMGWVHLARRRKLNLPKWDDIQIR